MEQYNMFSKELEEKIVNTIITIVNNTAVEARNKGGRRYLKKKDFCREFGISFNSLKLWESKGLKVIQVEGISLIDTLDVEKFLEKHKI